MKERIKFIDISRAFAIIFIVLGHTIVHSEHCRILYKFIYSFNVVLFFIISGYVFKIKSEKFEVFLKNKFTRIMIPYFAWETMFLIPYFLFGNNVDNTLGNNGSFSIKQIILNILIGNGNNSALKQNTSLWFLPALFTMEIVFYFIIKKIQKLNNKQIDIMTLVILFLIGMISSYLKYNLIWGLKTVLNIGVFFYIGYLLKKYNMFKENYFLTKNYVIVIMVLLGLCGFYFNGIVGCIDYVYGNYYLMFLSGLFISLIIINISYKIKNSNILEYIGRNTMGILIFHKLIVIIFQGKLGKISQILTNSNFILEVTISILVTVISIMVSLFINEIIRKISPILIGEKNKMPNNKKSYKLIKS